MFTNTYKPTKPEHLIGQQQRKTAQTLLDMIAAGELGIPFYLILWLPIITGFLQYPRQN